MWSWQQTLGLVAGILIAVSFIPQIWKLYQLKSAREISILYTLFQLCGALMWVSYGVILSLPAVTITNALIAALICLIFAVKLKYGKESY